MRTLHFLDTAFTIIYSDRHAWTNSVNTDQTAAEEENDQDLQLYTIDHYINFIYKHHQV